LEQSYTRGELFNLQLHPERIFIFKDVLASIIDRLRGLVPGIWVCKVGDIWKWWEEKRGFHVNVNSIGHREYEVDVQCSSRGTFLVRSEVIGNNKFYGDFTVQKERRFNLKSSKVPMIGIPNDSPQKLLSFLRNEGFIFEQNENKGRYSLYLDYFSEFSEEDELRAVKIIHESRLPLIRFWRWPNECQSALSITGDIDALTLIDYFKNLT
jgi:hypothetical protein